LAIRAARRADFDCPIIILSSVCGVVFVVLDILFAPHYLISPHDPIHGHQSAVFYCFSHEEVLHHGVSDDQSLHPGDVDLCFDFLFEKEDWNDVPCEIIKKLLRSVGGYLVDVQEGVSQGQITIGQERFVREGDVPNCGVFEVQEEGRNRGNSH
jgi:hypothetical protein